MSNLTHIPKWNHSLGKSEKKRNAPKYNFRKRLPDLNDRSCKTIQKAKNKRTEGPDSAAWYTGSGHQPEDSEEPQPPSRRVTFITDARITRRVGMFRNSKQSSMIFGDLPSASRRNVERDIERIVAPEEEVEYMRPHVESRRENRDPSPEYQERRRDNRPTESRRSSRKETRDPCLEYRERRRDNRPAECRRRLRRETRNPSPEYRERRRDSRMNERKRDDSGGYREQPERRAHKRRREEEVGGEFSGFPQEQQPRNRANARNDEDSRLGLYRSGYRPFLQQPTASFGVIRGTVSQKSNPIQQDSGIQSSDGITGSGSRDSSQRMETTSSLRRFAAAQEAIVRTPGRNLSQESIAAESDGTAPYPSKTLVKRILAAMPRLSLRDDRENRYSNTARGLLCGSISQQEDKTTLLQSLHNRTSSLHFREPNQSQQEGDELHEHLFQPDVSFPFGTSSSPPTPELERQFNQTLLAERERELTRELSAPENNNNNVINMLSPGSPKSGDYRTPLVEGDQSVVYFRLEGEFHAAHPMTPSPPHDGGFSADFPQIAHSPPVGLSADLQMTPSPRVVSPFGGNDFLMQLDQNMNGGRGDFDDQLRF